MTFARTSAIATRLLVAAIFCGALAGLLGVTIAFNPFAASARLDALRHDADLGTRAAGAWEFYADPDAVRRNSMDRQREAMAGPMIAGAAARMERFVAYAVPLGAAALVSGLCLAMLLLRREEDAPPPPPPPR